MRNLAVAVLVGLLARTGTAQEPAPPAPPVFPARVELVTLEVGVLGPDGQPLRGLRREDFELYENGQRQEIVHFEVLAGPRRPRRPGRRARRPRRRRAAAALSADWTYALVLDDLHLVPRQATDVKKAVRAFLDSLPSGARVLLVLPGARRVTNQLVPEGRASLDQALSSLRGQVSADRGEELISDHEAYDIHVRRDPQVEETVTRRLIRLELGDQAEFASRLSSRGEMLRAVTDTRARAGRRYQTMLARTRAVLGALRSTLLVLATRGGRRAVILASRGFVLDPAVREFEELQRVSLATGTPVSFLDARDVGGQTPYEGAAYGPALEVSDLPHLLADRFAEAAGSEALALDSGGLIIHRAGNLTKGLAGLVGAARASYLLGFQSSDPRRDGAFRKLRVELAHPAPRRPGDGPARLLRAPRRSLTGGAGRAC